MRRVGLPCERRATMRGLRVALTPFGVAAAGAGPACAGFAVGAAGCERGTTVAVPGDAAVVVSPIAFAVMASNTIDFPTSAPDNRWVAPVAPAIASQPDAS